MQDPKIIYLRNALLVDEEMLPGLGIRVGVLGHNRSDYDIMLMPCEDQAPADSTEVDRPDKRTVKTHEEDTILVSALHPYSIRKEELLTERRKIESLGFLILAQEHELMEEFPMKEVERSNKKYDKIREAARRRWILREMRRHTHKPADTYSVATTID